MTKQILPPPTFLTYSLGCRTNQAEISAISSQLLANSMETFNKRKHFSPDIVLINTCAVTLKAERESRKAIHHFKRLYPKAKIFCLGCAAKFIKDADLAIENKDKENALKIILKKLPNSLKKTISNQQLAIPNYQLSGRGLVKIQDGCNNFCSYCIVPFLRGKSKSVPPEEIICKIKNLVREGIKEIILCGINLGLYQPKIMNLIKKILKETSAERITLSSVEPDMISKEFADLFLNEPRLAKYFHLALQSGSQEVLKDMERKTDLKKLGKILRFIRLKCPEFVFRADILVGFPTETEKNFQETLEFIKGAPITFCHVFPFSIRPGTLAEKMVKTGQWQDFSKIIKKQRVKKIMKLVKRIQKEEGKKLVGKILPCLIIKENEAISNNSWLVKISYQPTAISNQKLKAKILPVRITSFKSNIIHGILY